VNEKGSLRSLVTVSGVRVDASSSDDEQPTASRAQTEAMSERMFRK
jgi:hypothetical protein